MITNASRPTGPDPRAVSSRSARGFGLRIDLDLATRVRGDTRGCLHGRPLVARRSGRLGLGVDRDLVAGVAGRFGLGVELGGRTLPLSPLDGRQLMARCPFAVYPIAEPRAAGVDLGCSPRLLNWLGGECDAGNNGQRERWQHSANNAHDDTPQQWPVGAGKRRHPLITTTPGNRPRFKLPVHGVGNRIGAHTTRYALCLFQPDYVCCDFLL